jgi:hypothetical protein
MTCQRVRLFHALVLAGSLGRGAASAGLVDETGSDGRRRTMWGPSAFGLRMTVIAATSIAVP